MSDYSELKRMCESGSAVDMEKVDPEHVLALIAENEGLRKDAERYRWLRSTTCWEDSLGDSPLSIAWSSYGEDTGNSSGEDLDAAVDAAISAGDNP